MRRYEWVLRNSAYGTTRIYEPVEAQNMKAATMKLLRTYPRWRIIGIRTVSKDGKRGELQLL